MDKSKNKIKVGILGVGAIGSVMTSLLVNQEPLELRCFNRSAVKQIGIQKLNEEKLFSVNCFVSPPKHLNINWLIICLKEHQFKAAIHWFEALIKPSTKVVVIRNGIQLKEPLLLYCQEHRILETMIDCPTQKVSIGKYKQFNAPKIICPKNELASNFAKLFNKQEIRFELVEDFKTANWKKVCESTAIGAITCLSGETCWVFKHENISTLYEKILEEGIAVAKADGAQIQKDFTRKMLEKLSRYPDDKGSSMLSDRLNGNPIELGAKSGAVVRCGKKYQIPTPLNELVCTLLEYTNRRG